MKVAILDDFQGVALQMADWSPVEARAEITIFRDHLDDPDAILQRLLPYRSLKNVVASPHVGFVTTWTYATFFNDTLENLVAWMNGAPIRVM